MEDHCNCRKPRPLLGFKAINSYGINPKLSYMIGDQISDVTFGHEIGCKSIQIGYFYDNLSEADFVATDILDAALWVNKEKEQPR
jgi:D-glycero-D-manno-heptose 1,7-bisphosphate phosphatase